jgi:hypothetical protein
MSVSAQNKRIPVTISNDQAQQLKVLSLTMDRSISFLIGKAIDQYLCCNAGNLTEIDLKYKPKALSEMR